MKEGKRRKDQQKKQQPQPSTRHSLPDDTRVQSDGHSYRLIGSLLIFTAFLLCIFPLTDTDFWWHLRTGQLIWERGTIPRTDWFLFTDSSRPWIDLHWGFQLLIAALYSVGGVNLVIVAKAALISAAVGICLFATGRSLPNWLRTLFWIPAVICISGRAYERPEMLSQVFLALWLWIAFRAERYPKSLWALPVIQLVWINCHALYVLGLVVGGCFAIDFFVRSLARGRLGLTLVSGRLTGWFVAGIGLASGLMALANPYMLDGAMFPLVLQRKFSGERKIYASIGEFQRPYDFFQRLPHGYESIYLDAQILLAVATFSSLIALLIVGRRWSPFRWFVFLAFARLAWDATRNVNIFAIVSATILTANAADLWRIWFHPADLKSHEETSHVQSPLGNLAVAALLLFWMFVTVTGDWGNWMGEKKAFGFGEKPFWFGHEAVQFAGQTGSPDRAFIAHIGLAATYEFHCGPEKKVFLDPRLEVATPETFLAHERILQQMSSGDPEWEARLRDPEGNLPVVILDSRNSRPAINGMFSTPGWVLVYADHAAAVFMSELKATELHLTATDPTPLMYPP